MKYIYRLLFLIVIHINSYGANPNFTGVWCWDKSNEEESFSVTLKKSNDRYHGGYSSIANKGNKFDEHEDAFNFKDHFLSIVQIKIKNGWHSTGFVQLRWLNEKQIEWLIMKYPEGDFLFPYKALLERC